MARELDRRQGNQFAGVLAREIALTELLTEQYRNGLREKLRQDLQLRGAKHVAGRIFCEAFAQDFKLWNEHAFIDGPFVEYHFYNELDNIAKFERLESYQMATRLIELNTNEFIEIKVNNCPNVDAYFKMETKLHAFLCSYEEPEMRLLQNEILYQIHDRLMTRDFGWDYNALSSEADCMDVTKEAESYLERAGGR